MSFVSCVCGKLMWSEISGGGADCQWKPSLAAEVSGLVKWSFKYLLLHVAVVMQRNMRGGRNACSCPGPLLMPVTCICVCVRSILSNSRRPHGLYPARLLCPWDSPGQNAGVGCHALLQGIFPTRGSNLLLPKLLHDRQILYHWATWEGLCLALVTLCVTPGGFCSVKRCVHCWKEETRMSGVNMFIESNAFNVHMTFIPAFLLLPINGTWGKNKTQFHVVKI